MRAYASGLAHICGYRVHTMHDCMHVYVLVKTMDDNVCTNVNISQISERHGGYTQDIVIQKILYRLQ